jgi:hypothetical protein
MAQLRRRMARLKLALLYLCCAPWDLALFFLTRFLRPLGIANMRIRRGVLWLDVRPGSLLQRRWGWSTTLGHLVLLQPGLIGSTVEAHELVHVRQYEGAVLSVWTLLAVIGLVYPFAPMLVWPLAFLLAPWSSYLGASLAAALRSERPYFDNHFERHARADASAFQSIPTESARKG